MVDAAVRVGSILDAAQGLMLKHGFRGTSMEAIARAARIAKPTLYAYFPDKHLILTTVIERMIAHWRAEFGQALRSEGDTVQRVCAAVSVKHKSMHRYLGASPHVGDLVGGSGLDADLAAFEAEIADSIEAELTAAGVVRARSITQLYLAASDGIARRARSTAELGPALRLLAERLLRPELPPRDR